MAISDKIVKDILEVGWAIMPLLDRAQPGAAAAGALARLVEDARAAAGPELGKEIAELDALAAMLRGKRRAARGGRQRQSRPPRSPGPARRNPTTDP